MRSFCFMHMSVRESVTEADRDCTCDDILRVRRPNAHPLARGRRSDRKGRRERETAACGTGEEIEERQTDRQAGRDDHAWSEDQGCVES